MVIFKTKSNQNVHQNAPDCINHFKIFSESMNPNTLACVQMISLCLYESSHLLFRILSRYKLKHFNCIMFTKNSLCMSKIHHIKRVCIDYV